MGGISSPLERFDIDRAILRSRADSLFKESHSLQSTKPENNAAALCSSFCEHRRADSQLLLIVMTDIQISAT